MFNMIINSGFKYKAIDINILDSHCIYNSYIYEENSPLFHSVRNSNMEMFLWLLRGGADINFKCKNGLTVYHLAFH
jgi:ankyrin repeat protein